MLQFTAQQIALMIQGQVEGDAAVAVNNFGKIEEAKNGDISFLANPKYENHLYETNASVVIVSKDLVITKPVKACIIRHAMPYYGFCMVLDSYFNPH